MALQLPPITLSKRRLQEGMRRLQSEGVCCLKWSGNATTTPKTLFVDRGGTAVFYSPSEKELAKRLIAFKNIVSIAVDIKEMAAGMGGARRVELRVTANGAARPLRLSMTEEDGTLVAQVLAKKTMHLNDHLVANNFHRRLREVWLLGDADGSGSISLQELKGLLRRLNVKLTPQEVEKAFAMVDTDNSNSLEYQEFVALFKALTTIRCLTALFRHYARPTDGDGGCVAATDAPSIGAPCEVDGGDGCGQGEEGSSTSHDALMTVGGMQRFFRHAQGELLDDDVAEGLIHHYSGKRLPPPPVDDHNQRSGSTDTDRDNSTEPPPPLELEEAAALVPPARVYPPTFGISLHEFSLMMVDTVRNGWFDLEHDRVFMAMDQPLHHYRIACSHNTYSSGSQFSSKSKTEMYHRVLRQGSRCVEIDCHNGSRMPMVYHHYTPTSEISFEDVVDAIQASAFATSPYPVVLSLEMHTDDRQTMMVAQMLQSKLGPMLLRPEELQQGSGVAANGRPGLPFTPDALQYRILVKWKVVATAPTASTPQHSGRPTDGASALRALVTVGGVHSKTGVDRRPSDIQSSSEGDMIKMVGKDFQLKNTRMMTRGYPSGSRMMDSSNMDPLLPWTQGVQMVAMNYQTWDEAMHIHEGCFRVNGRCGYVLKPRSLRTASGVEDAWLGAVPPKPMVLTVRILFGYQLCHLNANLNTLNTYVEVSVRECLQTAPSAFGGAAAADSSDLFAMSLKSPAGLNSTLGTPPVTPKSANPFLSRKPAAAVLNKTVVSTKRTRVVQQEGFLPYWDESFDFRFTDIEHTVLSIHVKDSELTNDKCVGYGCIPIASLMLGYRAVPLLGPGGEALFGSTVICNFSLRER